MADSLTWLPARTIGELIRTKQVSPVEVLDHFLGRIDEHNTELKALDRIDERVHEDAKVAEAAVLDGDDLGPLHGVPIAVKGHLEIEGLPQTFPFGSGLAKSDDIVVERLRAAGALVVGHTGMPKYDPDGNFDHEVTARNPWDTSRTPGISSTGSAAAVAAGLLPAAIGSDGAGSIRLPAAYTGLVGLHPTGGLVPWLGADAGTTATIGPLTRDVTDAATILSIIAGPDGRDPAALHVKLPDARTELAQGVAGLKVVWSDDLGFALGYAVDESEAVVSCIREAAIAMTALGVRIEATEQKWEDFAIVVRASAAAKGIASSGLRPAGDAAEFMDEASAVRHRNWSRFQTIFASYDLLVCPTIHSVAPPIDVYSTRVPNSQATAQAAPGAMGYVAYTAPFNHLKFPAVAVPCGFFQGLPVSMQIVGPPGRDATVLRLARAFADAFPQQLHPEHS